MPEVLATSRLAVGDMFLGPVAEEPLVAVVAPVRRGEQAHFLLLNTVSTRLIKQRLMKMVILEDSSIMLLDSKQEPLASWATSDHPAGHEDGYARRRFVASFSPVPWIVVLEVHDEVFCAPVMTTPRPPLWWRRSCW